MIKKYPTTIVCITLMSISFFAIRVKAAKSISQQSAIIEKATWLIGSWENKTTKGIIHEVWEKANDSTLLGKSYLIKDNDSISLENVSLEAHDKILFYIPTVENQNEGNPVTFKLTYSSSNQLIFENPKHDFPQKISYTKIKKDSLFAEVSGIVKGQLKTQKFPFKRIK